MKSKKKENKNPAKVSLCKRLWKKWRNFGRLKKLSIIATICLVSYTITGFLIIPAVAKNIVQKEMTKQLGRKVTIEKIEFNPYTLVLQIYKFRIGNSDHVADFVTIKEVKVNIQAISLLKFAVIVNEVKVDTPVLHITRTDEFNFDFDDLVELSKNIAENRMTIQEPEDKEPGELSFSFNNIQLLNAQIYVTDQYEGKNHSLTDVHMAIPFISNYEYHEDNYITPLLSGNLNGSKFKFEGFSKPFKYSRESIINFNINKMDIAYYDKYIPNFIKPKLENCVFDSNLKLTFEMPEGKAPELTFDGGFSVSDINLSLDNHPLFSLRKFAVEIAPSNLLERKIHIKKVLTSKPFVNVTRRKDQTLNLSDLIEKPNEQKPVTSEAKSTTEEKSQSPKTICLADFVDFTMDEFILEKAQIDLNDQAIDGEFQTTVSDINLNLKDLSTTSEKPATLDFGFGVSSGERFKLSSQLSLVDFTADTHLSISGIKPTSYAPYYQKFLKSELVSGELSAETDISVSLKDFTKPELKISNSTIKFADLILQDKQQNDIISVPSIEIVTDYLDLQKSELIVDSVKISDGGLNIIRKTDQSLNLMNIINQEAFPKVKQPVVAEKKQDVGSKPFRILLKTFELKNYGIAFEDRAIGQQAENVIYNINVKVNNIDTTPNALINFDVNSKINSSGELSTKGTANLTKKKVHAEVMLDKLSLAELQPYVAEYSNASIESGLLTTTMIVDVDAINPSKPKVKMTINSGVTDFNMSSMASQKRVVGWEDVQVKNLQVTSEPLAISIDKISVNGQYTHVTVNEDKTINLTKIAKKTKSNNSEDSQKIKPIASKTIEKELPDVKIKSIELNNCSLKVTDKSLTPEFESEVKEIAMKMGEISTKDAKATDILVTALIDRHSRFEIKGKINPLQRDPAADLNIAIRDIDLSSLTPYSGKYVGYKLAKGKLQLMLNYHIADGKIAAKNSVLLDQLTFGESVDSDDAISLPIKFALSIITDKRGQVKLDVPISGDLKDPKFSIGGAVITVLTNIFTNIVTSPFSFIASMYGGAEELKTIEFEAGSQQLTSEELEKMATIAQMMQDRPGIRIDVKGYADPKQDRETILAQRFELFLKTAMYNDLWKSEQKETSVDKMVINWDDEEEYAEILEEAYDNSPFEKEENFLGIVKSQPVDVMEKMIKDYLKVTDSDLRKLAIKRAEAISRYLTKQGKIDAARIFFIEPDRKDVANKMSVNIDIK